MKKCLVFEIASETRKRAGCQWIQIDFLCNLTKGNWKVEVLFVTHSIYCHDDPIKSVRLVIEYGLL